MKILITEPENFSEIAIDRLKSIGSVNTLSKTNLETLRSEIENVDILVIRLGIFISKELLELATNLKFIVTATTGLNHIDQDIASQKNVKIISLKGESDFLSKIPSTAEHTWLLILSLMRKFPMAIRHVENGFWDRGQFIGSNLGGKSIGLVGLGRVGQQVAKFAKEFNMVIQAFDPYLKQWPEGVVRMNTLEELIFKSDIISIHIPLDNKTQGLLNRRVLSNIRPESFLVNTSRGEVWDEQYVVDLLKNKKISGVATDVISDEQSEEKRRLNPLLNLLNKGYPLIITPHIGGATKESMTITEEFVVNKLLQLIK